jgi:Fur family transcriptional regulator, ferric uptake regulator
MDADSLHEKLNSYLSKKRLKSTKQRDAIIETFFSLEGQHVKIEELLEEVRKKAPNIGYATVYRTLMLLVEAGVAHQRHFHDGQSRFELDLAHHHDHLICTECDKIIEFKNDIIEETQHRIAKKHKFLLTGHKMELYGTCGDCRKNS